jgi:hypothetical protein
MAYYVLFDKDLSACKRDYEFCKLLNVQLQEMKPAVFLKQMHHDAGA